MKKNYYSNIKESIKTLNYSQLQKLKSQIKKQQENRIVAQTLEKSRKKLVCPHCNSTSYVKWGRQSDLQRYKCKKCTKTFNSLTNTPLANLRRKGHWLDYSKCLIEGKTIRKSANICGISKTTSFS